MRPNGSGSRVAPSEEHGAHLEGVGAVGGQQDGPTPRGTDKNKKWFVGGLC